MSKEEKNYDQVMMDAAEHVYVFALRRGIEPGTLAAAFDTGRDPGPQFAHTLTISIRNSGISVTKENVPHGWLARGTTFIDEQFSRCVSELLEELEARSAAANRPA
ncbi:MAG: hypothetical protein ABI771_15120 [Betaproteobacteria bacterium]